MKYDHLEQATVEQGPVEQRSRRPWCRLAGGLALATGMAVCIVCAVLHHKKIAAMPHADGEPKELAPDQLWGATVYDVPITPYWTYNESAPGCHPMPDSADQYAGIDDKRLVDVHDREDGTASIFVIGDWGATLPDHKTFSGGGSDDQVQFAVANAMKNRAKWADPQYVLNVGDNFYVGGLEGHTCQDPPGHERDDTIAKFDSIWVKMYGKLSSKPWLSVLGNHDYGGWRMDSGWPQQIGYSFINQNWIMPARYYTKRIHHSNFVVDYFMFDSNVFDAKGPGVNPDHNICGQHNFQSPAVGAIGAPGTCTNNGGMPSVGGCKGWFEASHQAQKEWVQKRMTESDADWKIVVTHFPCGYEADWYKSLKKWQGLDLVVTGHRHQQELWWPGSSSKYIQSFLRTLKWDHTAPPCVMSGGGGGIVSQKFGYADYGTDLLWYGFFHLTIHKDWMNVELINTDNVVSGNVTIHPHGSKAAKWQKKEFKKAEDTSAEGLCDSFCGDTNNPFSVVCTSMASCGGCRACVNRRDSGACDDFCGDWKNPWDKVCPWDSCKGCKICRHRVAEAKEKARLAAEAKAAKEAAAAKKAKEKREAKLAIEAWHLKLRVTIVSGHGLLGKSQNVTGKHVPDPYCAVRIPGGSNKDTSSFQTPGVRNNASPTWNYTGVLSDFCRWDTIKFSVFDKDVFPPDKPDELIGEVSLDVEKIQDDNGFDGELKLTKLTGTSSSGVLKVKIETVLDVDAAALTSIV
jgi:hypothetical protein